MEDFDLEGLVNPQLVEPGRGRKRVRNPNQWDKNKRKYARNSSEAHPNPRISCNHLGKEIKFCKVSNLSEEDVHDFHSMLYRYKSKVDQDNFLSKYMLQTEPKRHRPRKNANNPRPRLQTTYFVRKKNKQILCVCAQSFSSITGVQRKRLNAISTHFQKKGTLRKENRGGARIKPKDVDTTNSIIKFIKNLKCRESHYGRSKSVRLYMGSNLSLKKLWRAWKKSRLDAELPIASYSKFYKIFQEKFNIGFGNPRADVCSFCEAMKNKIKTSTSPGEKVNLIGQYRLHKLRAKKFYQILKEDEDGVIKVAFDMQQNQPLPMIRITETFYARQIWLYNLTFVIHDGIQSKENVYIYSWTEDQSARGSNEVASALRDFLKHLQDRIYHSHNNDNPQPRTLRLFSDAAFSQNKNSTIIGLLLSYVQKSSVFNKIEHFFPIRGHSFMPPDRVFGRIEQVFKKQEKIISPKQYHSILEKHGTLKILMQDWRVLNYKKCSETIFKTKFPFLMREQRVFCYEKGKRVIQVKNTYTGDFQEHAIIKNSMLKKWQKVYELVNIVPDSNKISELKKKDVQELLKFVLLTDEEQEYYNKALKNTCIDDLYSTEVLFDEKEPFL